MSELSLSPEEAYDRLRGIVVEVNGIMSLFRSEQYLSEADLMMAHASAVNDEKGAGGTLPLPPSLETALTRNTSASKKARFPHI